MKTALQPFLYYNIDWLQPASAGLKQTQPVFIRHDCIRNGKQGSKHFEQAITNTATQRVAS